MPKKNKTTTDENSEWYFEGCTICHVVSEAEEEGMSLSEEELRQAFQQANVDSKKNN